MNHVYNLRSKRCFLKILRSIHAAQNRFGFRVVHYSVQGDHFHFIVEAANRKSLSRGMQGLTIRIAKALNKVMERRGVYEREVVSPRTWLLSVGWRKAGDVDMTTVPGKL